MSEIARRGGSLSKGGEDSVLLDSAVIWLPNGAGYDYFPAKNRKD